MLLLAVHGVAGCSYGADVTFVRPRLERVVPVAAHLPEDGGPLRLDLVLLDLHDRALRDTSQIQLAAGRSYWLSALRHGQFGVHELRSTSDMAGGINVIGTRGLAFAGTVVPAHLVLVLDNSLEAVATDPQGARITASMALGDHLLCGVGVESGQGHGRGCSFPPRTAISLVALHNGGVSVVARSIQDRERLNDELSRIEKGGGGVAPLWDGLAEATRLADDDDGPGRGAVILYWASSSAEGSTASPEQVQSQLEAAGVPLLLIRTDEAEPPVALSDLVRTSGGVELVASEDLFELLVAAEALLGSWRLELDVTGFPPAEPGVRSRLSGRVSLDLGDQRWESDFSLPSL